MQSRMVRWFLAATGIGVIGVVGFAQWEIGSNPLLPKSSWPTLEAAKVDSSPNVRIVVEDDKQVNPSEDGIEFYYCDLASNPHNSKQLFAASLVHTSESKVPGQLADLTNVAGFYSHDGGESWTRAFYFLADTGNADAAKRESYSDASVCWGPSGSVHLVVMHGKGFEPFVPKKAGDQPSRKNHSVDFWRSNDAGKSWQQREGVPYFMDRPFAVVDTTAGPYSGRQYSEPLRLASAKTTPNLSDESSSGESKE